MDVSGFDQYVVERICVVDEYDKHSKCIVDAVVNNEDFQEFLSNHPVGSKEICASVENEIVFCGTIRSIQSVCTYLRTNVHIEAYSFTDVLDSEIHNRVFQNPDKTYSQVNTFFADKKVKIDCVEEGLGNEKIKGFMVQHNETDYEFLKRLYNRAGFHLFADARKRNLCLLEIGTKRKIGKASVDSNDIKTFKRTIYGSYEEIELCSAKIFEVGSELEVFKGVYTIISRTIESKYEDLRATYKGIKVTGKAENSYREKSYSLGIAKVADNAAEDHLGKIQVEFVDYDNEMSDKKIWIDYLSPLTEKGGGIITVPDIDEFVEVIMRNGECLAMGCVRRNELDEAVQDINKRYILSRKCCLTADEQNITVVVNKNKINITDDMIEISNGQFEIIIKEDQCKIGFDDSRIVLERDRIQSIGKRKLEMQSGDIEMEGRNSVKVKTSSFDVG